MSEPAAGRIQHSSMLPIMVLIGLIFVLNVLLVSPSLTPTLRDLNPHDETKYIDSGRSLVQGSMRGLEWSPMSSFLYAPIYLLVQGSPDWFVQSAMIGRHILFGLLWFSFLSLGFQFTRSTSPLILAGVLFITTTLTEIVRNPSDALFASFSALALHRVLAFERRGKRRDVWVGSALMGAAALSRNDGLFLFPIYLGVVLYLGYRRHEVRSTVIPAILPTALLVAAYLFVGYLASGSFGLGTGIRGQTAYTWSLESNFGYSTRQVNDLLDRAGGPSASTLDVIRADPGLFAQQVTHNLSRLPDAVLAAYGKQLGPVLFYLAAVGFYSLWRAGLMARLVVLPLWPIHLVLYLAFYLREGFLLLDHYVLLIAAAIGGHYLVTAADRRTERVLLSLPLAALTVYGQVDEKAAFLASGLIFLTAMWIGWLVESSSTERTGSSGAVLLVLFAAGLILRGGYPFPNYSPIGSTPMDRANHFLQDNLPRGARIASEFPLETIPARMEQVEWREILDAFSLGANGCSILNEKDVRGLYVTPDALRRSPSLQDFLVDVEPACAQRALVADPGSIQIYLVDH